MTARKILIWGAPLAVAVAIAVLIYVWLRGSAPPPAPAYWPTQSWRSATPEEQGFDSVKLAEGLLAIQDGGINIHSLLVIRNGSVVTEAYFYPYDGKTPHELASVTKSVMTTLIGIAADQNKLKLDQSMLSFFPERAIANRDALKERVTVRHLASMSSGLDSVGFERDEGTLVEMRQSQDWIQFALDRKMVAQPGTRFVYDSVGMHLLSAILQQATGMTALEYAQQNLFEPLDIQEVVWPTDPQGFNRGWGDIYLRPTDAAKLGYLWLHQGQWEGQQIVSREWVADSTRTQIDTGQEDDYGYGWWITSGPEGDGYAAIGRGGQRVQVVPQLNIIVATTGGGFEFDDAINLVAPALADPPGPLPANSAGVARLNAVLATLVQPPEPQPVPPLPATAAAVSGQTFVLEPNPYGLNSLRLDFDAPTEATLRLSPGENLPVQVSKIGLDGVYRMSPGDYGFPMGQRGYWADATTFVMEREEIANRDAFTFRVHFEGDALRLEGRERTLEQGIMLQGRRQTP